MSYFKNIVNIFILDFKEKHEIKLMANSSSNCFNYGIPC